MEHLGLDLGTTTISAAVLDADGRLLCTRTVPGGAAVAGQPWERKQDARGIEHAALSLLDGLLQEFPDIGCVGLTGQMHGIVYVDAAGQLLSPLYTWQDETGAQPGLGGKSMAARLTERTGYPLASGYGLVTLACHQAAGCIPDGAAAVCTIADYLAMRLSGRTAPRLTPSMAASLGLFDGTDFDREAVRRAGLPERLLPEVSEEAELGGGRLRVFAALGDNQASFIGAEDSKGTDLQKQTLALLRKAGEEGHLNFIGNIEAKEAIKGGCDVIVTDGFSGNILLKTMEGVGSFAGHALGNIFRKNLLTKLAAAMVMPGLRAFKAQLDPNKVGGTAFIGISRPVIKAHGSSNAEAIDNAIGQARQVAESGIIGQIQENVHLMQVQPE